MAKLRVFRSIDEALVVWRMEYQWGDAKPAANLAKHGIDFLDAIGALTAPKRIEEIDDAIAYGEARIGTVGMTRGAVLVVVTTTHDEMVCCMFSIRKATRHEQDK